MKTIVVAAPRPKNTPICSMEDFSKIDHFTLNTNTSHMLRKKPKKIRQLMITKNQQRCIKRHCERLSSVGLATTIGATITSITHTGISLLVISGVLEGAIDAIGAIGAIGAIVAIDAIDATTLTHTGISLWVP